MGYRSDVTAVFYTDKKENWPSLKLYVDENFPEELKGLLDVVGECGYLFQDDQTKWYPSYPEVQAFETFMEKFMELADGDEGKDLEWACEFVRIGEESEDVEIRLSGDAKYVLNLVRSVEVCI